jgi:sulfur-oxidizing protein SoxX
VKGKGVRPLLVALAFAGTGAAWAAEALAPYRVEGGAIAAPLAGRGDAARGKEIVLGRDANCILCHAVPDSGLRFMGDLGPPLAGTGARLSEGQLRLRVVDSLRVNPDTIMPSYYRVDGLNRVAARYDGKPVLTAQQVEDVVAYLLTLR